VRANNSSVTPFAGQIRWYETEALLRGGEAEAAREDLLRFDKQIGERRRYRIAYLRALAVADGFGAVSEATPLPETAVASGLSHLREAAALAEVIGLPGERWPL